MLGVREEKVGSMGSKQEYGDLAGWDSSRVKVDVCSSLSNQVLKMSSSSEILSIDFVNIRGQSGLTSAKQAQIESFLQKQKLDVLHLQEINICENSFSNCNIISSSYNIISNNSPSKYGTASLIKSDVITENINLDSNGRAIVFNIGAITLANLYLSCLQGKDEKLYPQGKFCQWGCQGKDQGTLCGQEGSLWNS